MINIIPIQEAYNNKIERQENLKGLKFKCHGSCVYVGKEISPGCYGCFYTDAYHRGFMLGKDVGLPNVCNKDCIYCFEPHTVQQNPNTGDVCTDFDYDKLNEWHNKLFGVDIE